MTSSSFILTAAARCDIGQTRAKNEDQVLCLLDPIGVLPNLFIVADGMGGHQAGDLASSEAVNYFREFIEEHSADSNDMILLLRTAAEMTNRYIYFLSKESPDYTGMGTTLVAATVLGERVFCVNVGDSRLYRFGRDSEQTQPYLTQVTRDHSVVGLLLESGAITEEEARIHPQKNMITRAIGIDETVEPDDFTIGLEGVSRLMMCSDGLSNMLSRSELTKELSAGKDPARTADDLVRLANEAGGKDNISVIVIDLEKEAEDHA